MQKQTRTHCLWQKQDDTYFHWPRCIQNICLDNTYHCQTSCRLPDMWNMLNSRRSFRMRTKSTVQKRTGLTFDTIEASSTVAVGVQSWTDADFFAYASVRAWTSRTSTHRCLSDRHSTIDELSEKQMKIFTVQFTIISRCAKFTCTVRFVRASRISNFTSAPIFTIDLFTKSTLWTECMWAGFGLIPAQCYVPVREPQYSPEKPLGQSHRVPTRTPPFEHRDAPVPAVVVDGAVLVNVTRGSEWIQLVL